jgi:hypothetical protein
MTNRREFVGYLSAVAGSYILVACGGGGGTSPTASSASVLPNSPISPNPPVSPNPPGGSTAPVGGSSVPSPVVAGVGSPDGTTILPAGSITDNSGSVWTVVRGVVYRNGATAGGTSNVSLLLWYGGMIYQIGSAGQFYVWSWAGAWLTCNDPRIASVAKAGNFYGINGHYDYPFTPDQIVTMLKSLSCTTYRVGLGNVPQQINAVVALAQAFQPAGLTIFALISQGMYDSNGILFTSESVAYTQAFATAAAVATALQPHGVTMYECGNELTRDAAIILNSVYAGTKPTDFNNTNWPLMRGAMRGMIAGVKSVQPSAQCGINFTVADVAAADALWDGEQPDGSSGYPTVRWDITTWHNYQVYGDIFDIGTDGAGTGFNLPNYCKARFGVPFMITEWNANPEVSEADRASYITEQFGEFYTERKLDNLQSVMYYELDSGDDTWGIVTNSGVPINPSYNAFASFVDGHPDD